MSTNPIMQHFSRRFTATCTRVVHKVHFATYCNTLPFLIISQDEAHALRSIIVSKQTKKGRKRKRKMAKALATIKVGVWGVWVQLYVGVGYRERCIAAYDVGD